MCCCDPTLTFSQLWFDQREGYVEGVACGFVTAGRADKFAQECGNDARMMENSLVAQLDWMYQTLEVATPCTNTRLKSTSYDWGTHQYIGGGYSSHQLVKGGTTNVKALMRRSYGKVYFAGEATHQGPCATTQSAVLTGIRAAGEVVRSITGNMFNGGRL